jgi:hypothetical protein
VSPMGDVHGSVLPSNVFSSENSLRGERLESLHLQIYPSVGAFHLREERVSQFQFQGL